MNEFSIRDIENLTGIKAHTIRIWEQRFNLIKPRRKESTHRIYDNEDLKKILRIAHLYNTGLKISKIAALTEEEVRALTLDPTRSKEEHKIYINQLIEAALDFDQPLFENILAAGVMKLGFESAVSNIMFPALQKIGLMWMVNKVSPAQEHFASAIILNKIIAAISSYKRAMPAKGKSYVLIFTPEEELHELPLLMTEFLLRKNEIAYVNAGKHSSNEVLKELSDKHQFTHLYFNLITNLKHYSTEEYLQKLSVMFPSQKIYYTGAPASFLPANVTYLKNEQAVKNLMEHL